MKQYVALVDIAYIIALLMLRIGRYGEGDIDGTLISYEGHRIPYEVPKELSRKGIRYEQVDSNRLYHVRLNADYTGCIVNTDGHKKSLNREWRDQTSTHKLEQSDIGKRMGKDIRKSVTRMVYQT